jgi:hypothetical protein
MDYRTACSVLGASDDASLAELKQCYRKSALQHHPDRGGSAEQFRQMHDAYERIAEHHEEPGTNKREKSVDYRSLLRDFVEGAIGIETRFACLVSELFSGAASSRDSGQYCFLGLLEPTMCLRLLGWLYQHADLLGLAEGPLEDLENQIRLHLGGMALYSVRPSVANLIQADVYKLEHEGTTYFVPLWHDQVTFDVESKEAARPKASSEGRLVVTCGPRLPSHMRLDEQNNLHVTVRVSAAAVLAAGCIHVEIGGGDHLITSSRLTLEPFQTKILTRQGPPRINTTDPYDIAQRADVFIHIELSAEPT